MKKRKGSAPTDSERIAPRKIYERIREEQQQRRLARTPPPSRRPARPLQDQSSRQPRRCPPPRLSRRTPPIGGARRSLRDATTRGSPPACDAPLVVVQLIAREGDSSRRAARARTSSTPRTITAILRSIWSPQSAAPQSCNVIGSKVFEVQRLERGGESPEAECGGRSTQQNSRGKSIRCR